MDLVALLMPKTIVDFKGNCTAKNLIHAHLQLHICRKANNRKILAEQVNHNHCGSILKFAAPHLHRQSLPSIVDCAAEHLVPHQLHVGWILTLNKPAQVMFNDVTRWLTTDRHTCILFTGHCIILYSCKN